MSSKDKILEELGTSNNNNHILFEQYKLYVEMANDVSNRRDKTNKYYLTLISLLITIFSIIISITYKLQIVLIPLIITIIICYIWMKNIESYSTLNRAKFDVINEIENDLPVKGFSIEWDLLQLYNYNELTKVEKIVPKAIIYILTIVIILIILVQKGCCVF